MKNGWPHIFTKVCPRCYTSVTGQLVRRWRRFRGYNKHPSIIGRQYLNVLKLPKLLNKIVSKQKCAILTLKNAPPDQRKRSFLSFCFILKQLFLYLRCQAIDGHISESVFVSLMEIWKISKDRGLRCTPLVHCICCTLSCSGRIPHIMPSVGYPSSLFYLGFPEPPSDKRNGSTLLLYYNPLTRSQRKDTETRWL